MLYSIWTLTLSFESSRQWQKVNGNAVVEGNRKGSRRLSAIWEMKLFTSPTNKAIRKLLKVFARNNVYTRIFSPGNDPHLLPQLRPSPASPQLRERCVCLRAFFSFHFQRFSSDPSPLLGRRRPLPASNVKTRSTEIFPGKILRLLSRSVPFSARLIVLDD